MSVAVAYCRARNAESAVAYDTLGGTVGAVVVSGVGAAAGAGAALATGCWAVLWSFEPPHAAIANTVAAVTAWWIRGRSMVNLRWESGAWRRTGLTSPGPRNGKPAAARGERVRPARNSARRIQLGLGGASSRDPGRVPMDTSAEAVRVRPDTVAPGAALAARRV